MTQRGRRIAERLARTNRDLGIGGRFFLAAVIMSGGRILASGMNVRFKHSANCCPHYSLHAEVAALKRACNPANATLYVCRVLQNGELGTSKPCPACQEQIKLAGLKKVCYTDYNQWHSMAVD